jgi:hypothetical protein
MLPVSSHLDYGLRPSDTSFIDALVDSKYLSMNLETYHC